MLGPKKKPDKPLIVEEVHKVEEELIVQPVDKVVIPTIEPADPQVEESLEDIEQALIKAQFELQEKLKAIQLKKKEVEEEKKRRAPSCIKVTGIQRGYVYIEGENIKDIHKGAWSKWSHPASGYDSKRYVYLDNWSKFMDQMMEVDPTLIFKDYTSDNKVLNELMNGSMWHITKKYDRYLLVKPNPLINGSDPYNINVQLRTSNDAEADIALPRITGVSWDNTHNGYKVPISEGWQLFLISPLIKSRLAIWDDDIHELIKREFERREKIKHLQNAEDSEVDVLANQWEGDKEFKFRAHQRVASEFIQLTGGKALIAYGTGTGKTSIGIGASYILPNVEKCLVVCPGQLRRNWLRHIKRHTGYEAFVLKGREPDKYQVKALLMKKPKWVIINYDILRTATKIEIETGVAKSSLRATETRHLWVEALNIWGPDLIILDESHYVKNVQSNQSKTVRMLESKHKLALSGTPVMSRPNELWAVLNWLYPDVYPAFETFCNQYGWGRQVVNIHDLREQLSSIMIKRMREDISKDLPPIVHIEEIRELSAKARGIYTNIMMGIFKSMKEMSAKGVEEEKMVQVLLARISYLKKTCCFDMVKHTVEKAQELVDSMEEDKHKKVLIFSQYRGAAYAIARGLGSEALCFVKRADKGFAIYNEQERDELVQEFQRDERIKYLVVTEKTCREGFDITEAGAVIFNDLFWTPAAHQQSYGRSFYREVDMHGGNCYWMSFSDTIMEWQTELLGVKKNTIDQIVDGKISESSMQGELINKLKEMFKKYVLDEKFDMDDQYFTDEPGEE